ncbi:hypothetical protein AB0L13_33520 [Saccharopolyspora shandongensis]|uniref:hypothetical protein n=1 Tax=Saccharopolyspora shandongensis TaxID=418495 RepID=UPI003419361A
MPEFLEDWDYRMDLRLRRSIHIEAARARAEAGLPSNAALALSVVWTSTGSNLRAPAQHIRIDDTDSGSVQLEFELRGSDLGGTLVLDISLVLAEALLNGRPAAPHRAGSVLWSDRHSMRLQGDSAQFPVSIIDFAKTSFPDGAAWHLQVPENLERATMGSLLLLVNERNVATASAFQNAGNPRQIDSAILSAVRADAVRTMIEHALRDDDFHDEASFPDDTWGATLSGLFSQIFPGRSIKEMRLQFTHSPNIFASELQAPMNLFEVLR